MKAVKPSRRSSPNSRASFGKLNNNSSHASTDSSSITTQEPRNSNSSDNLISTTKPLSKAAKATSKLSFFKSRIKQNENSAKNNGDSFLRKPEQLKNSTKDVALTGTDERYVSLSQYGMRPQKFGETFRVIRSAKESDSRPSSVILWHDKSMAVNRKLNSDSGTNTFTQKLKLGMTFNRFKSHQLNEKRIGNETKLSLSKPENFISTSAECVKRKFERNRTFDKEDFEAAGLLVSNSSIPNVLSKEPGLFRTYSEDCCERNYLENSPSLSSRASSFGILNDSYLLEQTFGGESVKGDTFEDDPLTGTVVTKRQRQNTFVVRDHSKDKVLSLSSLMTDSPRKTFKQDSKQKALSCTFVAQNSSYSCKTFDSAAMLSQALLEKLESVISHDTSGRGPNLPAVNNNDNISLEESERPVSTFSTCSADAGIVADYGVDGAEQQLPNGTPGIRPVSIISTSSVDTGYQPDSDVENCRISAIASTFINNADDLGNATLSNIQTSFRATLPGSLTVSPSSNLSKSMSSVITVSETTDGNNNDDHIPSSTVSNTHVMHDASNIQTRTDEKSSIESLDEERNVKDDSRECTEAMENGVTPDVGTNEMPPTKITPSTRNLFSGVVDDDEDEDDYLILSNGSTLFSGFADATGSHHLTSTPEKKGQFIAPNKDTSGCLERFSCTNVVDSGCGQMEKVSSVEDVTNSDSSPVDNVSDEDSGKPFASHPMELSCIMETDNETSLGHDSSNNVPGVEIGILADNLPEPELALDGKSIEKIVDQKGLPSESNVSGLTTCDSNMKYTNLLITSATLKPVVERVDANSMLKVTALSSEEQSDVGATYAPSLEHLSNNEEVSSLQNADSNEGALSHLDVNNTNDCHFEVKKSGSPVDPLPLPSAMKEQAEETKAPDDDTSSALRQRASNSSAMLSSSSLPSQQVNTTLGRVVLSSQDILMEVSRADKVSSGVLPSASSLPIIKNNGGPLKRSEVIENCLATESKEDDKITGESSSERKKSPKTINVGKSSASKKSSDNNQTAKLASAKTLLKPEKPQKLLGSNSTPKNVFRTPQSSSVQLKSRLSEPSARKNSTSNKYASPKLQTNLIGSVVKAHSMNVSLNHLVDGHKANQSVPLASSSSSSPKTKDKSLSPAGSDGKLEGVANQGKKATPKNLFQSSTDLKSKGTGEAGITVKSPFKKLPLKRLSVTQEPSKVAGGVPRRASVNVPTISTVKDRQRIGPSNLSASNPPTANLGPGCPRPGIKKPVIPPKPSSSRNNPIKPNLPIKSSVGNSSNKSSLNNSFNKSSNNINHLSCQDDRSATKLEEVLIQRDLQIRKLKINLWKSSTAFEALSVVVKYFETKVDKKHIGLMSTTKKLHQASSTLASLKEQLNMVTRQRESLLTELQRSEERHGKELEDMRNSVNAERIMVEKEAANKLEAELSKLNKVQVETVSSLKSSHKKEFEQLVKSHKNDLKDKEDEKIEEIRMINEQHERKMKNVSNEHKHQLDDLTFRFEQMKMTLLEKVDVLRSECDDLRCRESTFMESCQREAESQVQSCLARYKQLPQEIESLKAVLELRNQEVHELRTSNLERQKEHEELEESRRTIHFLKQKIENLEAIVDMRGDYERQLAEKHQLLLRKLERESKVNKRLSMDNEELQWKLNSVAQLPNLSLSGQQFPSAMSSSFTSGVTSLDRRLGKSMSSDRRPLSFGENVKQTPHSPSTPTSVSTVDVASSDAQQSEVFEEQPGTPSFLSFSPPRHHSARPARVSTKGSKNVVAGGNPRNKAGSVSGVCASGDGNKLQRSGTYSLKDVE